MTSTKREKSRLERASAPGVTQGPARPNVSRERKYCATEERGGITERSLSRGHGRLYAPLRLEEKRCTVPRAGGAVRIIERGSPRGHRRSCAPQCLKRERSTACPRRGGNNRERFSSRRFPVFRGRIGRNEGPWSSARPQKLSPRSFFSSARPHLPLRAAGRRAARSRVRRDCARPGWRRWDVRSRPRRVHSINSEHAEPISSRQPQIHDDTCSLL